MFFSEEIYSWSLETHLRTVLNSKATAVIDFNAYI